MSGAQASAVLELSGAERTSQQETVAIPLVTSVDVVPLSAAEPDWRLLEATAHITPYQRYDWISCFARHVHEPKSSQTVAVVCRDAVGCVQAILPLHLTRRCGLVIARYIGGKHVNLNMPLLSPAAMSKLDAVAWSNILRAAARLHGIDVFLLMNQPRLWRGQVNRLAELSALPANADVHMLPLSDDAEATINTLLSKERRKKLRNKTRRLAMLGDLRFTDPCSDEERRLALDHFLAQKAARFREQRIKDPFSDQKIRDFLLAASEPGPNGELPVIEFHALLAGERVVATVAGTGDSRRFSTMCISFDASPEIARDSPGEQIVLELIRRQFALGRSEFDLGIGEANYKDVFCNVRESLSHTLFAASAGGTGLVLLVRGFEMAKRFIKRHPAILRRLQPILHRL